MMHVVAYPGQGIIGALIRWQTRGRFGHAALCFDECGAVIYEAHYRTGVVRREFTPALDNARSVRWFQCACYEEDALRFVRRQVGKPYDLTMVLRFISRRQESRKSRGRWFCSELVAAALAKGGLDLFRDTEPWEVSPSMLARSTWLHPVLCPY